MGARLRIEWYPFMGDPIMLCGVTYNSIHIRIRSYDVAKPVN